MLSVSLHASGFHRLRGGSGAGVNITPIAFLVIQPNNVKLLPVSHGSAVDKLLDYMPDLIEKLNANYKLIEYL